MKLETLAIHAGREPDPATGALREPIHLATTFERSADGSSWQNKGSVTLDQRARRRVDALLNTHRPEPLPQEVQLNVHRVVERRAATLAR